MAWAKASIRWGPWMSHHGEPIPWTIHTGATAIAIRRS